MLTHFQNLHKIIKQNLGGLHHIHKYENKFNQLVEERQRPEAHCSCLSVQEELPAEKRDCVWGDVSTFGGEKKDVWRNLMEFGVS